MRKSGSSYQLTSTANFEIHVFRTPSRLTSHGIKGWNTRTNNGWVSTTIEFTFTLLLHIDSNRHQFQCTNFNSIIVFSTIGKLDASVKKMPFIIGLSDTYFLPARLSASYGETFADTGKLCKEIGTKVYEVAPRIYQMSTGMYVAGNSGNDLY